jgi:hypothetical protein
LYLADSAIHQRRAEAGCGVLDLARVRGCAGLAAELCGDSVLDRRVSLSALGADALCSRDIHRRDHRCVELPLSLSKIMFAASVMSLCACRSIADAARIQRRALDLRGDLVGDVLAVRIDDLPDFLSCGP